MKINVSMKRVVSFLMALAMVLTLAPLSAQAAEEAATLSFADTANRTAFSGEEQVWQQNGILFINNQGASTSKVADHHNPVRLYKSSDVSISYPAMSKLEFLCGGSKYVTPLVESITAGTVTVDGNTVTVVLDAPADTFAFVCSAQIRLSSLTVYSTPAEEEEDPVDPQPETVNFYFKNTAGWETVSVYYWAEGVGMTEWPGDTMTPVEDDIWVAAVPVGAQYIIFNNGNNGSQTTDMPIPTDGTNLYNYGTGTWSVYGEEPSEPELPLPETVNFYFKNTAGWETVSVYYWADSGEMVTWPGDTMTPVEGEIWVAAVPVGAQYIIFNNGNNGSQTTDMPIPTDGTNLYNYGAGTWSVYGEEPVDPLPETVTLYFNNTSGWSTVNAYYWAEGVGMTAWPGNTMTLVEGSIWSIEIPASAQMIIFNDGSTQTGDLTIPTDGTNLYNYDTGTWSVYGEEPSEPELPQPIMILRQPAHYEGIRGESAVFTVEAEGEDLTYQWYYFDLTVNDWQKSYAPGCNTPTVSPVFYAYRDGQQYCCVITDAQGNTVTTNTVVMTLKSSEVVITAQPENEAYGALNHLYTFRVTATGSNLAYRWEVSTDGGETWAETWLTGYNTETLTVRLNAHRSGNLYRCVVTSAGRYSVISMAAGLYLQPATAEILVQPENVKAQFGAGVTFTMDANGTDLTFVWYHSADNGATWAKLPDSNAKTLTLEANEQTLGKYLCMVTDGSGKTVSTEVVTLSILPEILTQPESITCAAGETAAFTVAARGENLKYRWYCSTDGGETWTETWLTGYNTDTLSFIVNALRASKIYKCVVTDRYGSVVETASVSVTIG